MKTALNSTLVKTQGDLSDSDSDYDYLDELLDTGAAAT